MKTHHLTKTAAMWASRHSVSIHHVSRRAGWTIIAPWHWDRLDGPSNEINGYRDHRHAQREAAHIRACIVLTLMGRLTDDAYIAICCAYCDVANVRALVSIGLRAGE